MRDSRIHTAARLADRAVSAFDSLKGWNPGKVAMYALVQTSRGESREKVSPTV
jgi:hypothetical protein